MQGDRCDSRYSNQVNSAPFLISLRADELAHFRSTVPKGKRSDAIRKALIAAGLLPDLSQEKPPEAAS
ncbi:MULTISPECIES: hypothetical protein [Leptolyngbya]|uniref:hypothetical protein n=1 Tax=Leptolyngbya TaxID=47251 RepID=UPI0016873916|nr:hypothetical protein [Leptolyngbya sp. FACHB-1624]MBD1856471.1 hypothetical protein [Leptolyngbya sp. FACHB-1624]